MHKDKLKDKLNPVYLRITKNIITAVWRTFADELIAIAKRRSTTILGLIRLLLLVPIVDIILLL